MSDIRDRVSSYASQGEGYSKDVLAELDRLQAALNEQAAVIDELRRSNAKILRGNAQLQEAVVRLGGESKPGVFDGWQP